MTGKEPSLHRSCRSAVSSNAAMTLLLPIYGLFDTLIRRNFVKLSRPTSHSKITIPKIRKDNFNDLNLNLHLRPSFKVTLF